MAGMTSVFVTGASSGFGAEIARRFATTGARVYLAARREDRIAALATELGATAVHLDVRDREAVDKAVAGLEIDVLVNNAGLALGLEPAPRASLDDWDQMVDTNCKGLLYVTRALLPGKIAMKNAIQIQLKCCCGSVSGASPAVAGSSPIRDST